MIIFDWSKTQIMCLMILAYIGVLFIREGNALNHLSGKQKCNVIFDFLFIVAEIAVLFDGITACTVNYLDEVPRTANILFHLGMFVAYEIFVTLLFWYWLSVTVGIPKKVSVKMAYLLPSIVSIILTALLIPGLRFEKGDHTNFSMGSSVYVCFICIIIYCILTMIVIISKYRYISLNKRKSLAMTLVFVVIILLLQIIFPEALVSSIAVVMTTACIYLTMENPSIRGLEHYQHEMVMGFATLVENKDDSTGGHIRRSSAYAVLIAKNLRKNAKYKDIVTRDFIDNLGQSAPMHDIGKIGIPDAILQKPGKLTPEEFEKMKEHPVIGGRIIEDTFGHLFNGEYENMAFQVAMYHHEKWNGTGYPKKLSNTDIPLCARIMAVADVFDAVSAKRCYRDAMPLNECYRIIEEGRGVDFDPDVVDAFMMDRTKIEEIYNSKQN